MGVERLPHPIGRARTDKVLRESLSVHLRSRRGIGIAATRVADLLRYVDCGLGLASAKGVEQKLIKRGQRCNDGQAQNLKVIGSNPIPATKYPTDYQEISEKPPFGAAFSVRQNRHRVATADKLLPSFECAISEFDAQVLRQSCSLREFKTAVHRHGNPGFSRIRFSL
jgi:hypothetical protein